MRADGVLWMRGGVNTGHVKSRVKEAAGAAPLTAEQIQSTRANAVGGQVPLGVRTKHAHARMKLLGRGVSLRLGEKDATAVTLPLGQVC